ncbi:MAG: hypothetical protein AB1346_09105 [Thermodesulfobacteriota bacterium]
MSSRRFPLVVACVMLAVAAGQSGCSKNEPAPVGPQAQVPAQSQAEAQPPSGADSGGEPSAVAPDEKHRVSEGKHFYFLAPRESATVTFERPIDGKEAKEFSGETPELKAEALAAQGYSLMYQSHSIDTFTRSLTVWTLSDSRFAEKGKVDDGTWEHMFFTRTNQVGVRWDREGKGVVTTSSGSENGKFEMGKLSVEELIRRSGGKDGILVDGRELTPSQDSREKEYHILTFSIMVTAPSDPAAAMQETEGILGWKGKGFRFHAKYNNNNQKFVVFGPATDRNSIPD